MRRLLMLAALAASPALAHEGHHHAPKPLPAPPTKSEPLKSEPKREDNQRHFQCVTQTKQVVGLDLTASYDWSQGQSYTGCIEGVTGTVSKTFRF